MFKKVIGHEGNEAQRSSSSASEERTSRTAQTPAQHSSGGRSEAPFQSSSAQTAPAGNTRNVLSSDVEIKGTVKFNHDLIVDGKIEGDIESSGNLTIGENARIKAEIKTGTIVVYGKVHGNMTASEKIELKASAEVIGDIKTKTLTIEAGAIFVGKSTVGTPSQAPSGDSGNSGSSSSSGSNKASQASPQPEAAKI